MKIIQIILAGFVTCLVSILLVASDSFGNEILEVDWFKMGTYKMPLYGFGHYSKDAFIDQQNNIFVTGTIKTTKYDPMGNILLEFDSYAGEKIAVNKQGDIFIAKNTFECFPAPNYTYDFCLSKYDSQGKELWKKLYDGGGNFVDEIVDMDIDANGNIYLTGKSHNYSEYDIFTTKIDSSGNEIWSSIYDSSGRDIVLSLSVDSIGNAFITGASNFSNLNVNFLIKYNTIGKIEWINKEITGFPFYSKIDQFDNIYVSSTNINKFDTNGKKLLEINKKVNFPVYPGLFVGAPSIMNIDQYGNIYAGESFNTGSMIGYVYLIKYDKLGNVLWHNFFKFNDKIMQYHVANILMDRYENIYAVATGLEALDNSLTHPLIVKFKKALSAESPEITVIDSVLPVDDLNIPFGKVTVRKSSNGIVTITNAGTANLNLGQISNTDLSAPFSITTDNCSSKVLLPSANCTLTVNFAPVSVGNFSDSFNIPSDDADEPLVTIRLSGAGEPDLKLSPEITVKDSIAPVYDLYIPFGSLTLKSSSTRTVTIKNDGKGKLIIGKIASKDRIAAPFRIQADTCSSKTLAPSKHCTLTVKFTPTSIGNFLDSFSIPSNDGDEGLLTMRLRGTGICKNSNSKDKSGKSCNDNNSKKK